MKVSLSLLTVLVVIASRSVHSNLVDCADICNNGPQASGVYTIYPAGPNSAQYVYCDMDTEGGKWMVIHRRMDGSVNFYRGWDQFKTGFGHAAGEYWIGLETLHLLTKNETYELRVDMEDFDGKTAYAQYSSFAISPGVENGEEDGYRLFVSGFQNGGAGDSLTYSNGHKFSTFDRDQDTSYFGNCVEKHEGAFWHRSCTNVNINGVYMWGQSNPHSVHWHGFRREKSLKSISMKIRPSSVTNNPDNWQS
ncbi:microfibril-associated glycoprotein 4-like [Alosa pseudoharengus]|uniref:microfibril-associated glycoprotein 4-like n=1 Tax=Alosa pseudoharengus TaxID=34774 RepID=UPI003F890646